MELENVENVYALTPMQEGMLFHTVSEPESGVFVEQISCSLHGQVQLDLLKQAWDLVVQRHASLRTIFLWDGLDEPLQVVRQSVTIPWQEFDWSSESTVVQQQKLQTLLAADRRRGLDLSVSPLMRMQTIRFSDQELRLVWTLHHLLADGWSTPLVIEDVLQSYACLVQGTPVESKPTFDYGEFIAYLQSQSLDDAEKFWREELAGFSQPTRLKDNLHFESAHRKDPQSGSHQQQTLRLSLEQSERIREFARKHRLTVNTVILGAWARLLNVHPRERDVLFGTTVSGRPAELHGVESAVGLFINTLPLRIRFDDEESTVDWLKNIQQQQLNTRQYEFSPLSSVQRWSDIPRGESLFESIVVFENYPEPSKVDLDAVGLSVDDFCYIEQSNYPLALLVVPQDEIEFHLVHDLRRFSKNFASAALNQISQILNSLVEAPELPATMQRLLSSVEEQTLLTSSVGEALQIEPTTIHKLIQSKAHETPDVVALRFAGKGLSYAELSMRSSALAGELQAAGVSVGEFVGLYADRSIELIVGMLGILMSGAAYVPLDPEYPAKRSQQIARDANLKHIVTRGELVDSVALVADSQRLTITAIDLSVPPEYVETEELDVAVDWESPAYVIYTSGSQGKPRGVPVSHRNLVYSTLARPHFYQDSVRSFLLLSSFAFDSSVAGIFWTLTDGGTLVLPAKKMEQDVDRLAELIAEEAVTHTLCLPTLYAVLLAHADTSQLTTLTTVIVAGEACTTQLVQDHHKTLKETKLVNEYGPTEATVWCTAEVVLAEANAVSIGRPIANTSIYVLDEHLRPVPTGVCGELFVSGAGVTNGYLNNDDQTERHFVSNPFPNSASQPFGDTLYRTGDLAYKTTDGNLIYAGRVDGQVKIRGYRIEPGEIETAILQDSDITAAVVVAKSPVEPVRPPQDVSQGDLNQLLRQVAPSDAHRLLDELLAMSSMDVEQALTEETI